MQSEQFRDELIRKSIRSAMILSYIIKSILYPVIFIAGLLLSPILIIIVVAAMIKGISNKDDED